MDKCAESNQKKINHTHYFQQRRFGISIAQMMEKLRIQGLATTRSHEPPRLVGQRQRNIKEIKLTYTLQWVNGQLVGSCCITQGAQPVLCNSLKGWDGVEW